MATVADAHRDNATLDRLSLLARRLNAEGYRYDNWLVKFSRHDFFLVCSYGNEPYITIRLEANADGSTLEARERDLTGGHGRFTREMRDVALKALRSLAVSK